MQVSKIGALEIYISDLGTVRIVTPKQPFATGKRGVRLAALSGPKAYAGPMAHDFKARSTKWQRKEDR